MMQLISLVYSNLVFKHYILYIIISISESTEINYYLDRPVHETVLCILNPVHYFRGICNL